MSPLKHTHEISTANLLELLIWTGAPRRVIHPKPIRTELRHHFSGLRLQLGAEIGDLAFDVRLGLLRYRDDRVLDIAFRYRTLRRGGLSTQPAPIRPDDRPPHGHAQNGAGAQAHLGSDAGSEMVHLDGRVLQRGWPVQYLCRIARRRQNRARGCLCHRLPAASGELILRTPETAG